MPKSKPFKSRGYQEVTEATHKTQAAKLLQRTFRKNKIKKEISRLRVKFPDKDDESLVEMAIMQLAKENKKLQKAYRDAWSIETSPLKEFKKTQAGSVSNAQEIAKIIQSGYYDKLDLLSPTFGIDVLKALEKGYIDKDQYFTAVYLHQSAKMLTLSSRPSEIVRIKRHTFTGENRVDREPLYLFLTDPEAATKAQLKIEELEKSGSPLKYYTMNLTRPIAMHLIRNIILYSFRGITVSEYKMLVHYFKSAFPNKPQYLNIIGNLFSGESRDGSDILLAAFREKNQDIEDELPYSFGAKLSESSSEYQVYMDQKNAEFIHMLMKTGSGCPTVIPSETARGGFELVVLPAESYNTLAKASFGNRATAIGAHIGTQEIRQQAVAQYGVKRRDAFLPDNDSEAMVGYKTHHSTLSSRTERPVETHPLESFDTYGLTHNLYVSPALRTLHDIYHAIKNSSHHPPLAMWLVKVHQEKAGLALRPITMSKVLETIIDADYVTNESVALKKSATKTDKAISLMQVFDKLTPASSPRPRDDFYLLVDELDKKKGRPRPELFGMTTEELFSTEVAKGMIALARKISPAVADLFNKMTGAIEQNDFEQATQLLKILEKQRGQNSKVMSSIKMYFQLKLDVKAFQHFKATYNLKQIGTYILYQQLKPITDAKLKLLRRAEAIGIEKIVYWSANSGMYLHRHLRQHCEKEIFQAQKPTYTSPYAIKNIEPDALEAVLNDICDTLAAKQQAIEAKKETLIKKISSAFSGDDLASRSLRGLLNTIVAKYSHVVELIPDEALDKDDASSLKAAILKAALVDADEKTVREIKGELFFHYASQIPGKRDLDSKLIKQAFYSDIIASVSFSQKSSDATLPSDTIPHPLTDAHQTMDPIYHHLNRVLKSFEKLDALYRRQSVDVFKFALHVQSGQSKPSYRQCLQACFERYKPLSSMLGKKTEITEQLLFYNSVYMALSRVYQEPQQIADMQKEFSNKLLDLVKRCDIDQKADFIQYILDTTFDNPEHFLGQAQRPSGVTSMLSRLTMRQTAFEHLAKVRAELVTLKKDAQKELVINDRPSKGHESSSC